MATAEVAVPITPPRTMVRGVLVNGEGRRFINEDTYFGHVGQAALMEQDGAVYLLADEPRYEVNRVGMRAEWVCADWDELGDELGLPPGSLAATMAAYNEAAARGEDPEFGKRPEWLVPLDEAAVRRDRPACRLVDLRGIPARRRRHRCPRPGRCARTARPWRACSRSGRVASSLALTRYCSGISLGEGTFFGRRGSGRGAPRAAR